MTHGLKTGLSLAIALALIAGGANAQERHDEHAAAPHPAPAARPAPRQMEPHPGPKSYQRVTEPQGWNARPPAADKDAYHHNFQAARSFKIGPYHRPSGWQAHRWAFGQILPRGYWASQYIIGDYWLFALEVPPAGYEWVRDDDDAILVNIATGEILQVEYGVFA